jgi:flavodoxin
MKTAIIYYSLDGNCAAAADVMKAALNADVFEIKTVDSRKRKGFFKILRGVFQVMRNKKPALHPLVVDIAAYELLILGTPVWVGSPAPAVISFLGGTKITGKKLALFCSHRGGPGKVFDKLKAILPGNAIAGEIDFVSAAGMDSAELKQKINGWIKAIGA